VIIGAMAEFERSLISARVKSGMAKAKAKGKRFGRRVKPGHKPSRTTLWRRARESK